MNYYNEWESFAAEWLKQLIKDGLIPDGEVDTRSIADVEPSDLKGFTQCHFFAGIGGWSRALKLAGWSPERPVWTGSPPCQSFSTAGKGKGKDDERHLWPVFFNLIRECQPTAVFGEQVAAAIRHGWLDDLQDDFQKESYASAAVVLPAGGVGAYHKRDRLFFTAKRVGNSSSKSSQRRARSIPGAQEESGRERRENGNLPDRYSDASEVHTAVANPNNLGHERSEEARRQAQRGFEHSSSVSVADSCGSRREWSLWSRSAAEEGKSKRYSSERSSHSSLGNSDSDRSQPGDEATETAGHRNTSDTASIWAPSVGDAEHDGSHGTKIGRGAFAASDNNAQGENIPSESEGAGRSEIAGNLCLWENPQIIYCRDGKYRAIPTEPALFPLADGISNRVGILRGAGNAIVPQAAAEIIKAVM